MSALPGHSARKRGSEAAIARVTVKIEKEYDRARRVVDAGDTLEPPVPRRKGLIFIVRVHGEGDRVRSGRANAACEPRELPDHRFGQGSRLAMISFTEKSAAAIHESAAP